MCPFIMPSAIVTESISEHNAHAITSYTVDYEVNLSIVVGREITSYLYCTPKAVQEYSGFIQKGLNTIKYFSDKNHMIYPETILIGS